jgi:hypothetical protein
MPCGPVEFNRRFGGTYCLHLQGPKVSQARYHKVYVKQSKGMEAVRTSETSADYTALHPEDSRR